MNLEELIMHYHRQQKEIIRLSNMVERLYIATGLAKKDMDEAEAAHAVEDERAQTLERAEAGDAQAQFNVGWMYYYAKGVAEDSILGLEWLLKAANQGHVEAQWEMGNAYKTGRGVPTDPISAYAWYSIAGENGFVFGKKDKDIIAETMFAGQLIKADELINQMVTITPTLRNT